MAISTHTTAASASVQSHRGSQPKARQSVLSCGLRSSPRVLSFAACDRAWADGIGAMMIGCAVFGYIIGSVTSIVSNQDVASAQLAERVSNLNAYMRERRLPRELQVGIRKCVHRPTPHKPTPHKPTPHKPTCPHMPTQAHTPHKPTCHATRVLALDAGTLSACTIHRYYKYYWSRRTVFTGEEEILRDLSTPLRAKLLRFMHRDVLEQMPLFEVCSDYSLTHSPTQFYSLTHPPTYLVRRAPPVSRLRLFTPHLLTPHVHRCAPTPASSTSSCAT
jgi:hypothetical protein